MGAIGFKTGAFTDKSSLLALSVAMAMGIILPGTAVAQTAPADSSAMLPHADPCQRAIRAHDTAGRTGTEMASEIHVASTVPFGQAEPDAGGGAGRALTLRLFRRSAVSLLSKI